MKNEITTTQFKKPYPQLALNGEMGLTSTDIAKSLGVKSSHIRQKLIRLNLKNDGIFETSQMRHVTKVGSKAFTEWVMNISAAKYIVATWKNKMGVGYFQYLLECERIAEEVVPKLLLEIETLRMKLAEFEKPKIKIAKENNKMVRVEVKNLAYVQKGLFGNEVQIITETKKLADLTAEEQLQYSFDHKIKVIAGLSKSLNESLENGQVITVAVPKAEEPKLLN